MERRTGKITVQDIPAGYDILWIAVAITHNMKGKMNMLQVRKKEAENWRG